MNNEAVAAEDKGISFLIEADEATSLYRFVVRRSEVAERVAERTHGPTREAADYATQVLRGLAEMIKQKFHVEDFIVPDLMGDVNAFHKKFEQHYEGKPRILADDLHDFRVKFHAEETSEYRDEHPKLLDALARSDHRDVVNSLELQLDALCDSVWVILGTADIQFGRPVFYEAWRRVVAANMAKVKAEPTGDDRSKRDVKFDIVKPSGWMPPDHRDLVQDHAHDLTVPNRDAV